MALYAEMLMRIISFALLLLFEVDHILSMKIIYTYESVLSNRKHEY